MEARQSGERQWASYYFIQPIICLFHEKPNIFGFHSEKSMLFLDLIPKMLYFYPMIQRILEKTIQGKLDTGKAIIVLGPRQVGKTTLLENVIQKQKDNVIWFNGDELDVQELFANASSTRLKTIIGKAKLVIIDEAQRISDIGLRLKLITDKIKDVQLIVSGSSAFELSNTLNEPLTGRKWEYKMLPLSFSEMVQHHGLMEERRMMPHRLVFGYYPDIVNHPGEEEERLRQLSDSYLYKDLLSLDNIKKSGNIVHLLRALAFQVGSQVSYNELSNQIGMDSKTVEKYIDILEKAFIIFKLNSYSNNLRNELSKSKKIYFYDNGILNSLIGDYSLPEQRNDVGKLWENYFIAERIKIHAYSKSPSNMYFWRTRQQQEIDLVEVKNKKIIAFELKWNDKKKTKTPRTFTNTYPEAEVAIVSPNNFDSYLIE